MSDLPALRRTSEPSAYLKRNRGRTSPPPVDPIALSRRHPLLAILGITALVLALLVFVFLANRPVAREITINQGGSAIAAGATYREAIAIAKDTGRPITIDPINGPARPISADEALRYEGTTDQNLVRFRVMAGERFARRAGYYQHWRLVP